MGQGNSIVLNDSIERTVAYYGLLPDTGKLSVGYSGFYKNAFVGIFKG